MNSVYHAKASARRWGGDMSAYLPVHSFIDSSKQVIGDVRHRSLYHHTLGCYLAERIFGVTISVQKAHSVIEVPVRLIAEQHIIEDLGWLPSPADYIEGMPIKPWMSGKQTSTVPLSTLALVAGERS